MKKFHFVMVKPSHYDSDGYVIQFWRSAMPSNTLATLYGLAADCRERKILGADVDIVLTELDETNKRVDVAKYIKQIRNDGGHGLIGLVGVQSNQFPRALELARQFRGAGLQVCIGGFHVSGCMAMLPELTQELAEAKELGVSLFAGEAEGRLAGVLQDAYKGELQPIYNFMAMLPPLENAPIPILSVKAVKRTGGAQTSFDAGRGCPYLCSFCTIINVQGRRSRFRSENDVEKIIRANTSQGIKRFFITDDNLARNTNWEPIFDRLIALREEGLSFSIAIQVDTACHKIPNFISKARRAGVMRVFIGLENINPESLKAARKGQNRITDYRAMFQMWRDEGVFTTAGYILGFPGDTKDSILRDIRTIKAELPVDILEFFFLTPLPGSQDHARLYQSGVEMDADLNKYDLNHVTTGHDTMSKSEWEETYRLAWDTFYSDEHVATLMRRARGSGLALARFWAPLLGSMAAFCMREYIRWSRAL